MKDFHQPPFKQNAIAIGFTLGVHIVAIVGLLYLGMSTPPEPPKQIRTVLIKPEDLQPTREVTEFTETAHSNVTEEITQTAEPDLTAPVIPTPSPESTPNLESLAAQAAQDAKKAEAEAVHQAQIEAQAKADAAAKAKADAAAKAKADAAAKAKADAAAKANADADRH